MGKRKRKKPNLVQRERDKKHVALGVDATRELLAGRIMRTFYRRGFVVGIGIGFLMGWYGDIFLAWLAARIVVIL